MHSNKKSLLPYVMWSLPVLFFAYQFILRLWPGLMMQQIMEQYAIDASSFGMLAAFYYYGYAGMQIPAAILLDKYGAKLVICALAVCCGLSTLAFTYTNNFYVALMSRFLVGAGSAVGFLGISKVISLWFPKQQYGRMVGLSFSFGLLGAIYGGKPVSLMISCYGWKHVAIALGLLSILIGVTTYLVLRAPQDKYSENTTATHGFRQVLASPTIWALAFGNLLMVGALEGFADVWGVQYLMKAYSIEKADAAGLISFVFFGMLFGGPLLAFYSKKFGNHLVIVASGLSMALCFVILLSLQDYNKLLLASLFFIVGVMCCYQVIVFALGSSLVSQKNLGFTIALLNCINMLGGSFFHTTIGLMMDTFWTGQLNVDGLKVYELETYQYAISFVPFCALLGASIIFVLWAIKKFKYRQEVELSMA